MALKRTALSRSWRVLATAGVVGLVVSAAVASARATPAARGRRHVSSGDQGTESSVWDGVYTGEQAKRGEGVYMQLCASCHQANLSGDEYAVPLTGPAFTERWNGESVAAMYDTIKTTMPWDAPDSMTPQQTVDVISFLMAANVYPAGKTELPSDPAQLKLIKVLEK